LLILNLLIETEKLDLFLHTLATLSTAAKSHPTTLAAKPFTPAYNHLRQIHCQGVGIRSKVGADGCWILGTGYWVLGIGYWVLDSFYALTPTPIPNI